MSKRVIVIEIGKIGFIQCGDYAGCQVKILDDSQNTGGFLILVCKDFLNPKAEGYDDWVESYSNLVCYFKESKWVVKWQ